MKHCEFHTSNFDPDEVEIVPETTDEATTAYYDLWPMNIVRDRLNELLSDEEE